MVRQAHYEGYWKLSEDLILSLSKDEVRAPTRKAFHDQNHPVHHR
jgi:hypothetical protein